MTFNGFTAEIEDISEYIEDSEYVRTDLIDTENYSECPFSPEDYIGEEEKGEGVEKNDTPNYSEYDFLYSAFTSFQKKKRLNSIKTAEKEELILELRRSEKRNKELEKELAELSASTEKAAAEKSREDKKTKMAEKAAAENITQGTTKEGVFYTLELDKTLKKKGLFILTFELMVTEESFPLLYSALRQFGWAYNREGKVWRNSASNHGKEVVKKFLMVI